LRVRARYHDAPLGLGLTLHPNNPMMRSYIPLLLLSFVVVSCGDSLQGGGPQPLPSVTGSENGSATGSTSGSTSGSVSGSASGSVSQSDAGSASWTALYASLFGASGLSGCGGTAMICHQGSMDSGVTTPVTIGGSPSGFICGTTASACYQGLLHATPPLITPGTATTPKNSPLYQALFTTGTTPGTTDDNMPEGSVSPLDAPTIAAITAWLQAGAPNN
jgi:hypothetical protein